MSKAEERAFERCPKSENVIEEIRNERKRAIFTEGYYQAEKDLELTWEDISIIREIMFDYNRQVRNKMAIIPNDKEYCEEVLKRFKERKKE